VRTDFRVSSCRTLNQEEIDRALQIFNRFGVERSLEEVRGALREEDRHLLLCVDRHGVHVIDRDFGRESGDVILRHVARRLGLQQVTLGLSVARTVVTSCCSGQNVPSGCALEVACGSARAIEDMRVTWVGARLQVAVNSSLRRFRLRPG
jgi:predicted signal transduction protein with EAL and GGDEF domain